MAAPVARNIEWVVSQKGNEKLIVNGYLFTLNGKGKNANQPNVRYWVCAASGCTVKAKSDGNILTELRGTVNEAHAHVNDSQQIGNIRLKVINLISTVN